MLWPTLNSERLNPFTQLRQLQREVQSIFDGSSNPDSAVFPAVNIWSNQEMLVITAELPGLDAKDLNISVLGDQLTIEGERKAEELKDGSVFYRRERRNGRFARAFTLPFSINEEKVSARFNNGILSVYLPKSESSKPKKIEILNA